MSEQQQQPQTTTTPEEVGAQRTLTGTVVSNKMQKTVSVSVERLVKHDRYSKYVRRTTKLLAHDEASECKPGDLVEISECRRLSTRKAWKVLRVVKPAGTV
jgi:small subunit ribosomal protein S17